MCAGSQVEKEYSPSRLKTWMLVRSYRPLGTTRVPWKEEVSPEASPTSDWPAAVSVKNRLDG